MTDNSPQLGSGSKPVLSGNEPRLGGDRKISDWDAYVARMQPVLWYRYEGVSSRVWDGQSEEVMAFKRALTPQEIHRLYTLAIPLPWYRRLLNWARRLIERSLYLIRPT